MGKTQLARALAEPAGGSVFEVTCASGAEPELRAFRFSQRKLILFDEVHPAQVAAQRLLFQSSTSDVALGCSATNCHRSSVYMHGVRMALCSNTMAHDSVCATRGRGLCACACLC